jgi:hypothetical protein
MANDRPDATELIETVREFLHEKLLPTMTGHAAFEVRIAANLLAIARRELEHGPVAAEAAHERLARIVGRDGTVDELEAALVQRIQAGDLSIASAALRAHLQEAVRDRLAIANPKYLREAP